MILLSGLMGDPALTPGMKAYLLDQEMLRAHAYLINIPMRYEFEKAFYTERATGEVPVSRLSELMSETQRQIYGDTLLADGTDPMFWAYKMHFHITGVSFYNFPYVFGYLLSQALFARFKEVARKTLGADLTSPDFWAEAIRAIEPTLAEYERLS
jgi:oligoendopeptidase F